MGPNIEKVDQTSQATPLSEDLLKILQGILDEGGLGTGVGPLQRESGTAIQQFVNSLTPNAETGRSEGVDRLVSGLEASSASRLDRSAADLREAFGVAGSRFGSPLATGEALLRSESNAALDQNIGSILEGARQFDTQALLQGIMSMFNQGQTNTNTFLNTLPLGVFKEETIVSPGVGDQLLAGAIQGGSNLLKPAGG